VSKINKNETLHLNRRKAISAALAPIVAAGAMTFGAVKYAEAVTPKPPKRATPDQIAQINFPSFSAPKDSEAKIYVAGAGEDAEEITSFAYPDVGLGTKRFIKLEHMVNKQLPATSPYALEAYDQEISSNRVAPLGAPVKLTQQAHVPKEHTLEFFIGDYKNAKDNPEPIS
jgi:hypothetical protein